jgi:transcriptional regulator with XRE-family HTH domain
MRKPEREPTNTRLIEFVLNKMRERGLSQRNVSDRARAAGYRLSHGYVGKFMTGQVVSPTLDRLAAFAAGLGVHPLDLCRVGLGLEVEDQKDELTELGDKIERLTGDDLIYFRELIKTIDLDADRRLRRTN